MIRATIHRLGRLGVGLALGLAPAEAIYIRHDVGDAASLSLGAGYSAVGRLGLTNERWGSYTGTGTLVTPTKILTAAHMVDWEGNGLDSTLANHSFRLGANVAGSNADLVISGVASVAVHPRWAAGDTWDLYDLAVITLHDPVVGVTPMTIYDGDPVRMLGTMVGYGDHGLGTDGPGHDIDGRRRAAQNMLYRQGDTIRSDFDHPNGSADTDGSTIPVLLEGSTAEGDSGGPLLVDFGFGETIVGVMSSGFDSTSGDGYYGDVSSWAPINHPQNLAFLASQGITPIPEPGTLIFLAGTACAGLVRRRRR